jgi:hypothetical protein
MSNFKKATTLFLLSFLSVRALFGQVEWSREYPKTDTTRTFNHIMPTSDGNFLLLGYSEPLDFDGTVRPLVIKTNKNGVPLWEKEYANISNSLIERGLNVNADGSFAAIIQEAQLDRRQISVAFFDANGNFLSVKRLGDSTIDNLFRNVISTRNGQFLLRTTVKSPENSSNPFIHDRLYRLTRTCDVVWQRTYSERLGSSNNDIAETSDGGFLFPTDSLVGFTDPSNYSGVGIEVKINANGGNVFSKALTAGPSQFSGRFSNGQILRGNNGINLIAVNEEGNLIWRTRLDWLGVVSYNTATIMRDDKIAHFVTLKKNNVIGIELTKLDVRGRVLYQQFVPSSQQNLKERILWSVQSPTDTCLYAAGHKENDDFVQTAWFTKFCTNPATNTQDIQKQAIELSLSSNPITVQTIVDIKNVATNISGVFELTDVQGRKIMKRQFSGNQFTIERANMVAGLYFLRVSTEDQKMGIVKIVIQ